MAKAMVRSPLQPPTDFAKVHMRGLDTIDAISENRPATRVYVFLIKYCERSNSLVCSQDTMADMIGLSKRTISRGVDYLLKKKRIAVAKVGTANCYILDVREISKVATEHEHAVAIAANVLLSKRENPGIEEDLRVPPGDFRDLERAA